MISFLDDSEHLSSFFCFFYKNIFIHKHITKNISQKTYITKNISQYITYRSQTYRKQIANISQTYHNKTYHKHITNISRKNIFSIKKKKKKKCKCSESSRKLLTFAAGQKKLGQLLVRSFFKMCFFFELL